MKLPRLRLPAWWRPVSSIIVAGILATGLLVFRLGSLAPHISPSESQTIASSAHYRLILNNPLYLPQKVLVWLALKLPHVPLVWQVRLPSVALGLLALLLMAYVLYRWYGRRSMVLGVVLFAMSAWMLHIARFGGPDILYVAGLLAVLASHILLQDHEEMPVAWFVWLASNLGLLFIPGFVWFVVLNALCQWRTVGNAWLYLLRRERIASTVIAIAALGALGFTFFRHHTLVLAWLGLPQSLSLMTLQHWPMQVAQSLLLAVWRGPDQPELWLGQLPLVGGLILVTAALGAYFYARHWQASRSQLLASFLLLSILLISFGRVSVGLLVPILYIVAIAGLAYALHRWHKVFPRNPLARGFGVGVIVVLVVISCYYNAAQYFVAWPHNPKVEQIYRTGK